LFPFAARSSYSAGAQPAAKEIHEGGRISGKPVQLIAYEGTSSISAIAAVATRLVQDDHIHAITGMSDTDMVLPAARITAASKTVFVTYG